MTARFRPRLLSSALVASGLALLAALGTWQASRYLDKLEIEARVAERSAAPPLFVESARAIVPELAYRRVRARGVWDMARSQLFKHRQLEGAPGFWLVTPLTFVDGSALLVNRGWIPFGSAEAFVREERTSPVEYAEQDVEGLLLIPESILADEETRARIGREGPPSEASPVYGWDTLDIDGVYGSLSAQRPGPPALLVATARDDDALPIASTAYVTKPYMTSERHLGYAAFWYTTGAALLALWVAASFGLIGSRRSGA